MRARALPISTLLLLMVATPVVAQLITIRTVPISQSHQFDLFPSVRKGMGGVAIAVDDSLGDPFSNPAKGSRFGASSFFGSPGLYSVSSRAGAGRTLPLGALVRSGDWFGAASVAVQQVDLSENAVFALQVPIACRVCDTRLVDVPSSGRSNGNAYTYTMLGKVFPNAGISLGGSVFWAGLNGIDGVDLLYAGSSRLRQDGHAIDLRFGAQKEWVGDRSLSALVVHNRFATTHDVFYLDTFWDPGTRQFDQRPRREENLDHTNTWGLHLQYAQPLAAHGWRLGWTATTNLMSHPKLPNYQIQQIQSIPRDPGNSEAFNFGVGLSKVAQASTFALDLLYEPIWSYTWADAAGPIETATGQTIPTGGKTVENWFRFNNAILRMGLAQDLPFGRGTKAVGLQLGLAIHSINYSLDQRDNVGATTRGLDEGWVEWAPTWGLSLRFPAWEVRYRGQVTNGTGRPGVFAGGIAVAEPLRGNVLVAPNGPLTLSGVRVMTHQVSVSFPFR